MSIKMNRMLEGENVTPHRNSEAKKLIGCQVQYLCGRDIDRSGRGYFFPQTGTVNDVYGRNIQINDEYIYLSTIVEMRIIEPKGVAHESDSH